MTEGDGSSLWIDFALVNAEFSDAIQRLAGEGFVDFPYADVVLRHSGVVEQLWDGNGRADSHLVGLAADHDSARPFADDG